ncbi:MAG: adenylyltransferase/cytidyltransferase family protein [Deltaproteobacteria bacterium]|nr:adenylyltransferase/cytidyltransferase family protein [Deltaproteobacteria bacterium]
MKSNPKIEKTFSSNARLMDRHELKIFLDKARAEKLKIGLCHGCFDLIHPGHLIHFNAAKQGCDILIVSITADAFIHKGPGRPLHDEATRAQFLTSLRSVDAVYIVNEASASDAISLIRPDFYFKGIDYKDESQDRSGMITKERLLVESFGGKLAITDTPKLSSTKLIKDANLLPVSPEIARYFEKIRETTSLEEVSYYIDQVFSKLRLSVIGDFIVDEYVTCSPVGTTSKSPTISAIFRESEVMAGGSAAIARHLSEFVSEVHLICQKGEKNWNFDNLILDVFPKNLKAHWVALENLYTPHKIRYMSEGYPNILNANKVNKKSNKLPIKLFEFAFLNTEQLSSEPLFNKLSSSREILTTDGIIWADFGHGLLNRTTWDFVRKNAKYLSCNVQTNSTNFGFNLVSKYHGADLVCIDELEARLVLGDRQTPIDRLWNLLSPLLGCKELAVTRGQDGIGFWSESERSEVPALQSNVIDPVGAGDAVLAMLTLCKVAKAPPAVTSLLSTAAGGLACAIVGNREPVRKDKLLKYISGIF